MLIENCIDNGEEGIIQSGDYMDRPRIHALMKKAVSYPVIVVCALCGYGKTHAVYSFLKQYDARVTWLRISENDNSTDFFWKNYSNQVSLRWPEIGFRLEEIGFPESNEAFLKYNAVRLEAGLLPGKHIRVFDDFHLLQNTEVLKFFERSLNKLPSNLTLILITRTMPEINLVGMMMRENVFTIQEDALRFTEEEIVKYFNQYKYPLTKEDTRKIFNDTQGCASVVNLIRRSLSQDQKYDKFIFEAVKKNIFRKIEVDISKTASEKLRRFLLRVSLIDNHASGLVKSLVPESCADDGLIREMERLNAYIRYDFITDTYMIQNLFHDYLKQTQEQVLTDNERKETYQAAGLWCEKNGYHTDALFYYEKSCDYDSITRNVASFNVQMPWEMALNALEILDRIPENVKSQNPIFPSMYLKLKINLGHFDEAQTLAQRYAQEYEARDDTPERNRALCAIYTFWGLLRMKMCTYTDVYDFDIYFKKISRYYNKNPFKLIGPYKELTAGAWVSKVGTSRQGAMDEYIAAVSRVSSSISHELAPYYEGLEDLLRGELYFYQRQFNDAEQYLKQSIASAREHDQYITQNLALTYLMHIQFSGGDYERASGSIKEMETLLNEKDYGVRYTMYDIACAFYHLALEKSDKVPQWLKGNFSPFTHSSFLENYANRIRARYHYQTHQYNALLDFIKNSLEYPMILFGRIELKVLQALTLYKLKKRLEAIAAFTEAYDLSEPNGIITSFTEFGKDMRTLTLAAHKDNTCTIPKKWLEDINRISSAYAKRKIKMKAEYTQTQTIRASLDKKLI